MSVPFIPTRNSTAGSTAAPTTSQLTTVGQCAINTYTGSFYMRKEDNTISEIVGDRLSGFRNRIINGNMAIDQRNAGTSVTIPTGSSTYVVDRFQVNKDTSALVLSVAQSSTAPAGFNFSQAFTVGTGASVVSGELLAFQQKIEGANIGDLSFGSASSSPVTLSFWVRSNLIGTYAVSLSNSANNRSYVQTYSISAANTWEQKSITIPGDTSGTWLTTNGVGIRVGFDLGSGSSYNTTAGAWQAGNYTRTSGTVSWGATTGNTFYITGVQLEKGLVPTPFEVRSYVTELALCQRYFCALNPTSTLALALSTTTARVGLQPQSKMRTTPTFIKIGNLVRLVGVATDSTQSAESFTDASSSASLAIVQLGNFSGLVAGSVYIVADSAAQIGLNSEL